MTRGGVDPMNWRCLIGLHDWDDFGECRRDWTHVQRRPGDWELYGGPWSRIARHRYRAKMRAGEALQARLAAMGEDVTLQLCADVARDPAMVDSLIAVVRERQSAQRALR